MRTFFRDNTLDAQARHTYVAPYFELAEVFWVFVFMYSKKLNIFHVIAQLKKKSKENKTLITQENIGLRAYKLIQIDTFIDLREQLHI